MYAPEDPIKKVNVCVGHQQPEGHAQGLLDSGTTWCRAIRARVKAEHSGAVGGHPSSKQEEQVPVVGIRAKGACRSAPGSVPSTSRHASDGGPRAAGSAVVTSSAH